jgi:mono/diheme cytochrome c family protein
MSRLGKAICGTVGALLLAGGIAPLARGDNPSETLFKQKCGGCHGADGKGTTPMAKTLKVRDLSSDDVQKQSDADLTTIIAKGKNKMPTFEGKLKPEEIKGLVAYIRSMAKK